MSVEAAGVSSTAGGRYECRFVARSLLLFFRYVPVFISYLLGGRVDRWDVHLYISAVWIAAPVITRAVGGGRVSCR